MNTGLECIIDWLQFTIKGLSSDDVIMQVLNLHPSEFLLLPKGRYGYLTQYTHNNIIVLANGSDGMGVHVILSGKGCRQYEVKFSLLDLVDSVNLYDGQFTRIDICADDRTGKIIPFKEIIKCVHQGYCISKWKTSTEIYKRELKTGNIIGETINFGSRSSKIYMRIYDKAKEQNIEGDWIRLELEIKDKSAEVLQLILLFENGVGKVISGLLNQYIRFIMPSNDKNKSRWPTESWWLNMINKLGKLSLTRKPEEKSIREVKTWFKRQMGPTLAMIMIHEEGDLSTLFEMIASGKRRLKSKHFEILNKGDNNNGSSNG